jgi:hypothetical protein
MSDLFHTRFPGLVCTATWQNSGDNPVVDEDPMVSMVSYVLLIEIYEDPLFFPLCCWFHSHFVSTAITSILTSCGWHFLHLFATSEQGRAIVRMNLRGKNIDLSED